MTDTAARLESHLAERYRIQRELGEGGMATVYLAEDIRHHRKVAIKVLHPELSAVLGPERFLKEIELTANLQHPHILPLFDSGSADGLLFYVMPYVDGETLRRRLDREQQLPITDALRIASEVAEALDYAHKRGVVHRDIKPENILLHDGRPLVADFGIALAVQQAGGARMTQTGMSLGTPQYMAPEQAMGDKSVDHRADIYALGAVTYEMLAGEPPFTGPNSQAIVAKILTTDPSSLHAKRRSVPDHVEDAVLTALEKMPADRFGSAVEFRNALAGEPAAAAGIRPRSGGRPAGASRQPAITAARLPLLAAAGVLLLVVAAGAGWMALGSGNRAAATTPVRFAFAIGTPGLDRPYVEISPDGRRIIQAVEDSAGSMQIVMRELGSTEPVTIPGGESALDPSFSPDGEWIAYSSTQGGRLRKIPAAGGPAIEIADSAGTTGWTWDGHHILFTRPPGGIWRVSSSGGPAEQLTALDTARREFAHWYPQGLPGNRAMIFTSYATPAMARARIEAYDFRSRRRKVLVEGAVFGRYAGSGHLLFMREGAVFAVQFDPAALEVRGSPVPVIEDVAWRPTDGLAAFATARNGTLVFIRGADWDVRTRIGWLDRSGRETPVIAEPGAYAEPRLSPDGRWVALTVTQPKREIWLYDIPRGVLSRLTRAEGAAFNPLWTPDSRSIIYTHEDPVYDIHRIRIDGGGTEPLVTSSWDKLASSISADGRQLVYQEVKPPHTAAYVTSLGGNGAPRRLIATRGSVGTATLSPDGRWIAYTESADDRTNDRANVYIAAADGSGGRRQVSVNGGSQPHWTRGGRELIYRRGDALFAVSFDPLSGEIERPVQLFSRVHLSGPGIKAYDVTADGNRFLMALPVTRPQAQPTVVVLNWFEELRSRVRR